MCGLCGYVLDQHGEASRETLVRMADTLRHRGPDDSGYYVAGEVALGFRRLSIVDLAGGHQPITNEDGTVWLVFNGEIYNFLDVRAELVQAGHTFVTRCDSEVIVHGYEAWGDDVFERLSGMFAIAIWDVRRKRLVAARDRMGKKPFYYARARRADGHQALVFGSEVKALRAAATMFPDLAQELDPLGLARYLAFEYVPSPETIYKGVRKLEPGERLVYENGTLKIDRYWNLSFRGAVRAPEAPVPSEAEITTRLRHEISGAVKRRLMSDVPLGVFLSGGIDSSTVVAFMADHVPAKDIKTFSITFDDPSFDEGPYARQVAKAFGTDHHEECLDPRAMLDALPEIANFLDEPLGDASIIPTYLLSKFTRKVVTVALGGDGGDELFSGYPTFQAERLAPLFDLAPELLQRFASLAAQALPVSTANFSFDFKVRQFLRGAGFRGATRHQVWLGSFAPDEALKLLHPDVAADVRQRLAGDDLLACIDEQIARLAMDARSDWDRLQAFYARFYLADDVLVKVDRASMAASLEVRAPLLDQSLVEYVSQLGPELKLRGLTTKYILKRAVRDKLPAVIWQRPKKGFGIPVARWLRNELRPLGEDYLGHERIRQAGIFDADYIDRLWREHQAGQGDHRKPLWTLLAFELWRKKWL